MPASDARSAATAERRKQAIALRLAGMDWQSIADRLDYASRGAACQDVTRALKKNLKEEAEQAELLRTLTVQRYDRLQAAWWPKALQGDPKAAEIVLKILAGRSKIEGTEAPKSLHVDLERRLDLEGQAVADAITAALDTLNLTPEQHAAALEAAQQRLLDTSQGEP